MHIQEKNFMKIRIDPIGWLIIVLFPHFNIIDYIFWLKHNFFLFTLFDTKIKYQDIVLG